MVYNSGSQTVVRDVGGTQKLHKNMVCKESDYIFKLAGINCTAVINRPFLLAAARLTPKQING